MSVPRKRILILFAHPRYEQSRVNRALLEAAAPLPAVTVHDLYEACPDFHVDVPREQALLAAHEILLWQFPFYIYGAPALLKQWLDTVLAYGWAHGPGGEALRGKTALCVVTTGGTRASYAPGGAHAHPLGAFLLPFAQTAALCGMGYLPPFAVQGTYRLTGGDLARQAALYRTLLARLAGEGPALPAPEGLALLNDALADGAEGGPP